MPMASMAWATFSEAVAATAASLGFHSVAKRTSKHAGESAAADSEQLSLEGDHCIATFSRDVRGKTTLCVCGNCHDELTLRALGEELSRAVVQQYIYRTLLSDIQGRGLDIVREERQADRTIRLEVRHLEN